MGYRKPVKIEPVPLAEWLREKRMALKESQWDFAHRMGVRQSNVALIELGRQLPSVQSLARLGRSLGYKDLGEALRGLSIEAAVLLGVLLGVKPDAEQLRADGRLRWVPDLTRAATPTAWLVPDVEARDKYGRRLAYVELCSTMRWDAADGGETSPAQWCADAGALLLDKGYARVFVISPNTRRAAEYLELEAAARRARRGMWRECWTMPTDKYLP